MKRLLLATLIISILFSSFPLTTKAEENTDDFIVRMKETYGVNIIEEIPATPEGQQYLENALAYIGPEVLNSITSIKKLDIYFRAKKNSSTLGSSGSSSSGYYIILYEGFPRTTPIHEVMHVVNFVLDRYVSDIDDVIASFNDGRKYGTTWKSGDEHYFAYSYGKTRASDDIATIPGSIYANRDGIADRIKSNESPALRRKWEYLRDLCNLYLGQSPMFEILGHQNPTPNKIELSASKLILNIGETHKLTATVLPEGTGVKNLFKYNGNIVSVDSEGNVTAKKAGLATITVQAGRVIVTCTVDVRRATSSPTPIPTSKPTPIPISKPTPAVNDSAEDDDELKDGTYYIKASKNKKYVIDLTGSSKANGAKLILYTKHGASNQKFQITKVSDNKYKIKCVHSGKWWKSSGTKGSTLTQTGSSADDSAITFTITRQANGTYRIKDSNGLYVGISGAKMKNKTKVILWTKASDKSQAFVFEKID